MIQKFKTILLSGVTVFIAFCLIKYPDQSFEASIRGLTMWWEIVFPSLLPFFITAELLIGFGVVKFIGVLFEPIMRPLFNVPGSGSFAWAMGMASGYPTGAKISTRLREDDQITQIEAERLVSFTNASSPLFIFGAVSVGFFYDVKLGMLLASSHYIGNAIVGICMRFHGTRQEKDVEKTTREKTSIIQAFREMHRARMNDTRPFGKVVGDAILNSIQTLVMVGGFIILFSVITKLLFIIGVSPLFAAGIKIILQIIGLPADLAMPLFSGLFEITQGAKAVSQTETSSLLAKMVIVSFILGFNGFSIQAQVASIIAPTDIRFAPYFFARILHGIIAGLLTVILYKPLYLNRTTFNFNGVPVSGGAQAEPWVYILYQLKEFGPLVTLLFLLLGVFILLRRHYTRG
ncbi:sporulation integral membrane protein YlbJ [Virgibacillus kekensis]|uniref:Sporulation integral membrane protein YlbJ n=1 Tax=Virgibacillus kekensis TaxID=202261 RepID=A0ABV9DGR6_9BACI